MLPPELPERDEPDDPDDPDEPDDALIPPELDELPDDPLMSPDLDELPGEREVPAFPSYPLGLLVPLDASRLVLARPSPCDELPRSLLELLDEPLMPP